MTASYMKNSNTLEIYVYDTFRLQTEKVFVSEPSVKYVTYRTSDFPTIKEIVFASGVLFARPPTFKNTINLKKVVWL